MEYNHISFTLKRNTIICINISRDKVFVNGFHMSQVSGNSLNVRLSGLAGDPSLTWALHSSSPASISLISQYSGVIIEMRQLMTRLCTGLLNRRGYLQHKQQYIEILKQKCVTNNMYQFN